MRIPEWDEPEPDLAIVAGVPEDYRARHPGPEDIALLVEVAETTLDRDRGDKLLAYSAGGIAVYWIVNLVDHRVEVYTQPSPSGYLHATGLRCRPGDPGRHRWSRVRPARCVRDPPVIRELRTIVPANQSATNSDDATDRAREKTHGGDPRLGESPPVIFGSVRVSRSPKSDQSHDRQAGTATGT